MPAKDMEYKYILSQAELDIHMEKILLQLMPFRYWLFSGEMGSGKTTFVRYLAKFLGNSDEASSPSYSMINEYHFNANQYGIEKIYHLDLYRLNKLEEVIDIGVEEVLQSDALCIIEWPELVLPLLSGKPVAEMHIQYSTEDKREYIIKTKSA